MAIWGMLSPVGDAIFVACCSEKNQIGSDSFQLSAIQTRVRTFLRASLIAFTPTSDRGHHELMQFPDPNRVAETTHAIAVPGGTREKLTIDRHLQPKSNHLFGFQKLSRSMEGVQNPRERTVWRGIQYVRKLRSVNLGYPDQGRGSRQAIVMVGVDSVRNVEFLSWL